VYVLVLGMSLLVASAGVGALLTARMERMSAAGALNTARVRMAAMGAMEEVLAGAAASPLTFRQEWTARSGRRMVTVDGITVVVTVTDPVDGDFAVGDSDDVVFRAEARVSDGASGAREVVEWRGRPVMGSLSVLNDVMAVSGACELDSVTLAGAGTVSVGGRLKLTNSVVEPRVECSHVVTTGTTTTAGGRGDLLVAREWPRIAAVASEYVGIGQKLGWTGNALSGVLSPTLNPFGGSLNARGVYVVDAAGGGVTLEKLRVVGTLVIVNAAQVTISEGVVIEPAEAGLPALILEATLVQWDSNENELSEASDAANYNPAGAAYRGVSDTDRTDSYAPGMRGLVYIRGGVEVSGRVAVDGALVVDGSYVQTSNGAVGEGVLLVRDGLIEKNVQGFGKLMGWELVAGSMRRVVE
jgi:hypothetical protein